VGQGVIATLGIHPSEARDTDGAATALLKHLLVWGAAAPLAWIELEGCLILRMDDPGGAQNVHSRHWSYPKLGEPAWAAIGAVLKHRDARLSIGYVAGWVDDGDPDRGTLQIAGRTPPRVAGQVYPSPLVTYQDRAGHAPGTVNDYQAEYRGIQGLRAQGLADVELHGHTHMHPDAASWAQAPDRYEARSWYRELGSEAEAAIAAGGSADHPLALGLGILHRYFGVRPTTLICPGDEWTNEALERALELGLQVVSSYYLALRHNDRFCWATHVCAPYLNEPQTAWFDSGLPVVGYFHDREPALEGEGWVSQWLDRWQEAGARQFVDFRAFAAAVACRFQLAERAGSPCLTVRSETGLPLVRPLTIGVRLTRPLPAQIAVVYDDQESMLAVHPLGDEHGQVVLPPADTDVHMSLLR
jgi:hypothetical protein